MTVPKDTPASGPLYWGITAVLIFALMMVSFPLWSGGSTIRLMIVAGACGLVGVTAARWIVVRLAQRKG